VTEVEITLAPLDSINSKRDVETEIVALLAPLDSIFCKRDVVLEVVVEVPLILDVIYYRRDVVYCREDAEIEVGIHLHS